MGTNMNFKDFGNGYLGGDASGGNKDLEAVQPSVYAMTFDEIQSSMGGLGKDFGSMNLDEMLKSIMNAEETQAIASSSSAFGLHGQGLLSLPRTLSQKTVDEVRRDIYELGGNNWAELSVPQRQLKLGEMTLEEFLERAGAVREEPQNGGFFGELVNSDNKNTSLLVGFQQTGKEGNCGIPIQSVNFPFDINNAIRSNEQQQQQLIVGDNTNHMPIQSTTLDFSAGSDQQKQKQPQQQLQIYPKLPAVAPLGNGIKSGILGFGDQNGALEGGEIIGLGGGAVVIGEGKSNIDTAPVPYMFTGGLRARKSGTVEKVIERRQRRMIKNRESAARSRARKQAYTVELEVENSKLKQENEKLRKKKADIVEIKEDQVLELMNAKGTNKRLKRTWTGPW